MDLINLLGAAAGTLTTIAFVPQVLKTWRTRSGDDISTGMFLLFSSGVLLWLLYGVALNATPIIIANSITLILALTIILLKMRYRSRDAVEES